MTENARKFIMLAVSLVVMVALIATTFILFNKGKQATDTQIGALDGFLQTAGVDQLESYAQKDYVLGSTVTAAIEALIGSDDTYQIIVLTNKGTTSSTVGAVSVDDVYYSKTTYTKDSTDSFYKDSAENGYVNPAFKFGCTVQKNKNGIITSVTFTTKQ